MRAMNPIWLRFVMTLLPIAMLTGGVGWYWGLLPALMSLAGILLLLLLRNIYQVQRLWQVLDAPAYGQIPSALGLWGEIYYRLHKLVKRWRLQVLQVEQQHSRFIQAIQASPNGVLMLDDGDQIEWCNAVAEQHFGLNAKRDLQQRITHLVRKPEFVQYLLVQQFDEPLTMHDMGLGKQNILSVQIFPYGENRKLLLSQDVTKLEKTDAMRRDFVANVSHELKTPLTVLAGFLETVRSLPLPESDKQRYLDMMAIQAERMQTLVNDLLTLAKLEGDVQPPVDSALSVSDIMEQLVRDAEGLSQGRHVIAMQCEPGWEILGAEAELLSAFGNLVSNAVRYTPESGTITLRWQTWREGMFPVAQMPAMRFGAVFSVQDTGLGIAAEHIPRLTERFYRVDRSRSRETGGTGLGLAIVKHVLSRHQAMLWVESEEGRGSTFSVLFSETRLRHHVLESVPTE